MCSKHIARYASNLHNSIDDPTNPFSRYPPSRHSIAIRIKRSRTFLHPVPSQESSHQNRSCVNRSRNNESHSYHHHARMISPHPMPSSGPKMMSNQHTGTTQNSHYRGEHYAGSRNAGGGIRCCYGNCTPGRCRRDLECTLRCTAIVDATVCRGEQDVYAWGNETCEDGPNPLGQPLLFR